MSGIIVHFNKSAEIEVLRYVHGYHVYKDRLAGSVRELLMLYREHTIVSFRYAVAMIKEETTISHLINKKI